MKALDKFIEESGRLKNLYELPKVFPSNDKDKSSLKILIINAPCMGFGDVIFASKFAGILYAMYGSKITIMTTRKEDFLKLGQTGFKILELDTAHGSNQCRRLQNMKLKVKGKLTNIENSIPVYDLIFVAPLSQDFYPSMSDVKAIIPYSTKFNTFVLSEYNDVLRKNIDINTGIGRGRYGLLFYNYEKIASPPLINNPYCVIYVANTITRVESCVLNFISMVSRKYRNNNFDIILPSSLMSVKLIKKIKDELALSFNKIIVQTTSDLKTYNSTVPGFDCKLRFDILPQPHSAMLSLIKNSVDDILLTGDQSITDALTCCSNKNIFYQIAPWKESFGKALAKALPNEWLFKKGTSCGSIKAIDYKSNYNDFVNKWDFTVLARPLLNSITSYAYERRRNKTLKFYEECILKSKTKRGFLNKFR